MNVKEYQDQAHSFANYYVPGKDESFNPFIYPAINLSGEAGEVAGKFAKAYRDDNGVITEERKQAIVKELGDVLWFVAELCTLLGVDMEDVMEHNISKLASRKERGVLFGSGDDR